MFPLQFKSQAFEIFLQFKALVENTLDCKIKSLQSDGGGEFTSHRFKILLSQHGISHHIPCPHTLEQNGVAERKHRHSVETGLALLAHSVVPLSYWNVAFDTVVFLINHMPTCVLHGLSPYEK